jgi:hypothetical protein
MVMVNRKSIRLLTAWVLAAAMLAVLGSDALAMTGSVVWGHRSTTVGNTAAVGTQASTLSKHVDKPGIRPYAGEPDAGGSGYTTPAGSQLSYWQMVLLGLIQLLPGQRLP